MSLTASSYQLIDFGTGRKLERFGNLTVDRPCPGANAAKSDAKLWGEADLSYGLREVDRWHQHTPNASTVTSVQGAWLCESGGVRMLLKQTPAGQVGVFPEHWAHWDWLREVLSIGKSTASKTPRIMSLFAYTGATTLAMAKAGYSVTHVDASKPTVAWARENSSFSNLDNAAIRWIVDDAATFVKRELKRNSKYEAIVLDPPTYGHGAKGNRWEIHRHLLPLLQDCWQLLSDERRGVLLCGHSSHIAIRDINKALAKQCGSSSVSNCEIVQANLHDSVGRTLDCGFAARYSFPR